MGLYFQGLTMGLAYVAPIGMQNLFVINSALTRTRRNALITAVIVIFFDIVLSLACFFGIGAFIVAFCAVGGLTALWLGWPTGRQSLEDVC